MLNDNTPYWPETLLMIGAGASVSLGMQTTEQLGKALYVLSQDQFTLSDRFDKILPAASTTFKNSAVNFLCFLENDTALEGVNESRCKELRDIYDWVSLKKIIRRCPGVSAGELQLQDVYNLIDMHLQSGHGFGSSDGIVRPERIQAARNTANVLVAILHASAYQTILTNDKSMYDQYFAFAKILADRMKSEGLDRSQYHEMNERQFYMFSYSVISMNWDPLFLWLIFNAHKELNDMPAHIGNPALPMKLFHDMAHFMAVRSIDTQQATWFPMNETAVQRLNDPAHQTGRRIRMGKFYFPHGSHGFRECPNCGKLTFYLGDQWSYDSPTLFAPSPIQNDEVQSPPRTRSEQQAREIGTYDAVVCTHCGTLTEAHHTTMVMQTNFKGQHPPYIEEIQRDMKVSIEKANHVILFGYSFPTDDFIYRSIFAARKRLDSPMKCSIVNYGENAPDEWLAGSDLETYARKFPNDKVVEVYKNLIPLFGQENIRVYGKGIPDVFLEGEVASREKVEQMMVWSD